jgi:hypothetical protein
MTTIDTLDLLISLQYKTKVLSHQSISDKQTNEQRRKKSPIKSMSMHFGDNSGKYCSRLYLETCEG